MGNKCFKVEFRNKMFGYRAFATLDKEFNTRNEAKKWIKDNKKPYIDKIKIKKC